MLKTLMTEERLKGLFVEVQKGTNNFTDFSPKALMKNSNRLIVFRLALGLSQENFGQICNLHFASISLHERIENKRMIKFTANKFMDIIETEFRNKQLIGNVKLDKVLENFNKFKNALKGGSVSSKSLERIKKINELPLIVRRKWLIKGGINSLMKRELSKMEKTVFLELTGAGINIKNRFLINNREIDFAVFEEDKLLTLIEVIDTFFDPFKILEIRKVTNKPIICILKKKRRGFLPTLSIIFDKVFFDDEIGMLIDFIKENSFSKTKSIIKVEKIETIFKINDSEKFVLNSLNGIIDFSPQVKFNVSINDVIFPKIVDFVFPKIIKGLPKVFLEIKNRTDPLRSVLDTSLESIILKHIFPSSKFILFLMLKDKIEMWKLKRVLSLDTKLVGIDKICFDISELKDEIKKSLGERPE